MIISAVVYEGVNVEENKSMMQGSKGRKECPVFTSFLILTLGAAPLGHLSINQIHIQYAYMIYNQNGSI